MTERVEVDSTALCHAADLTQNLAENVRGVLTELTSSLDAVESSGTNMPWGNDKLGRKFTDGDNHNGYAESRRNLLLGLDGMASTLTDFATGQRAAADELTRTDADSASGF